MTNAELYLAAKEIINLVHPNLTVIKAYQSKRAPTGSYAEVDVFELNESPVVPLVTLSDTEKVNSPIGQVNDVAQDIRVQLISQIAINFYRENANELAVGLMESCWRPDVHEFLLKNNLGWQRNDPVANLSATINGKFEERAKFVVYLMHEKVQPPQVTNAIYSTRTILKEEGVTVADFNVEIEDGD